MEHTIEQVAHVGAKGKFMWVALYVPGADLGAVSVAELSGATFRAGVHPEFGAFVALDLNALGAEGASQGLLITSRTDELDDALDAAFRVPDEGRLVAVFTESGPWRRVVSALDAADPKQAHGVAEEHATLYLPFQVDAEGLDLRV